MAIRWARRGVALLLLAIAPPAAAQIQSRPTDPPLVTAANESWYRLREPIQFAGDLYFRAGPTIFFDGNTMVRSGYYNGVPLYMDTTVEPYSIVLVPVRSGLMQPYERLRRGELAGTTASRMPSFPGRLVADRWTVPGSAGAPTEPSRPISGVAAEELVVDRAAAPEVAFDAPRAGALPARPQPMVSINKPESNDGVWIHYQGRKWVSAGAAVPLRPAEFRAIGQYEGFPVFVRRDEHGTIYLPTRGALVAPYKAR